MRRVIHAIGLCVAVGFFAGNAAADTYSSYNDGADYLKMTEPNRLHYVMGLSDMMDRMCHEVDNLEAKAFCDRVARCTAPMKSGQLLAFIDSYMQDGEDKSKYAMASNYRAALNTKCPQ